MERNPVEHRRQFTNGTRRAITFTSRRSSRISRWSAGHDRRDSRRRPLGIFGDSVTTDHISPAGAIKATSPAGKYLKSRGIRAGGFQQLRSAARQRSGDDARHVRQCADQEPDGAGNRRRRDQTFCEREGEQMSIFDAAMKYAETNTPLIILAGHEYGTGSSRDWAAKGTRFVRRESGRRGELRADSSLESRRHGRAAVAISRRHDRAIAWARWLARSFRSPACRTRCKPGQNVTLEIEGKDGQKRSVPVKLRIDTPIEIDYYRHGGILPFRATADLLAKITISRAFGPNWRTIGDEAERGG